MFMHDYCKYHQQLLVQDFAEESQVSLDVERSPNFSSLLSLRQKFRHTFYGISLEVAQLQKQQLPQEALNCLIDALNSTHFVFHHHHKWWRLMRQALNIIQHAQSSSQVDPQSVLPLLKIATHAPQPWQGENISYCFATLSLSAFSFDKIQKALEFIRIAHRACPDWAYPAYLIGWYGLQVEGIEPIPYFVKAITQDKQFLARLEQDPLALQFPEVTAEIKTQVLQNRRRY